MNNRIFLTTLTGLCAATLTVSAQDPAPAATATKIDFQALEPGPLPDEFMSTDGEAVFAIVDDAGNHLLRMDPSPIVEGGVLVGKSTTGGVTVKAKFRAESKRRIHPRYGVGLHGVGGLRLRIVPASKALELVKDDEVKATATWTAKPGTWTWVELSITADGDTAKAEGRVWLDGEARPDMPLITTGLPGKPGQGKASVWATPFASLPVDIDDIEVTPVP